MKTTLNISIIQLVCSWNNMKMRYSSYNKGSKLFLHVKNQFRTHFNSNFFHTFNQIRPHKKTNLNFYVDNNVFMWTFIIFCGRFILFVNKLYSCFLAQVDLYSFYTSPVWDYSYEIMDNYIIITRFLVSKCWLGEEYTLKSQMKRVNYLLN